MPRCLPLPLILVLFVLSPVHAQQAPPTLALALAQAEAPSDTVWLAVAAEKTTLPKDTGPAPALPPGSPLAQIAGAYGRITQAWETAGAVAPSTMTVLNTDPGTPHSNPAWDQTIPSSDALYGVPIRTTLSNAPKPSDLNAADLTAPVAWAGVKTVGDLVTRLGLATHLELYADLRYANRNVTLIGPPTARAGDLLRALALCVCGTYRKVSPAYVLTDDLIGLGTRQAIISRLVQEAEAPRAEASDWLFGRGGDLLPARKPGVRPTEAQRARAIQGVPLWRDVGFATPIPFAQLAPAQQDLAQRELNAFRPTCSTHHGMMDPNFAAKDASSAALASLMVSIPRRAVYARPRTAQDVDAVIASMKSLGFNQLWLDVFSEGKSRLTGRADILTEALAKTKGTGIAVMPTLDLLDWTTDAPADAADRTVLGETSAQEDDFQRRYAQPQTPDDTAEPSGPTDLSVCPAAPIVERTLTALVRHLAAVPGVAEIALRDTATDGYDGDRDGELGYTPPLRLACLRRAGVDPVDLEVAMTDAVRQEASLPEFTGDNALAVQGVSQQWDVVRAEADVRLMRRLLAAAQESAGRRLPFLIQQRGWQLEPGWWGLWDDPLAPLPFVPQAASIDAIGSAQRSLVALAHSQCRVDVYSFPFGAAQSQRVLTACIHQMWPGWDGFMIDASATPGFTGGAPRRDDGDPLAALVQKP